jgi:hypothetical protein
MLTRVHVKKAVSNGMYVNGKNKMIAAGGYVNPSWLIGK